MNLFSFNSITKSQWILRSINRFSQMLTHFSRKSKMRLKPSKNYKTKRTTATFMKKLKSLLWISLATED